MANANKQSPNTLDLAKYPISQNYRDTLGSKKLMSHVFIGKQVKIASSGAVVKWTRIDTDRSANFDQIYEAQGVLEESKWPDLRLEDLVNITFMGRMINGLEHPKAQMASEKI